MMKENGSGQLSNVINFISNQRLWPWLAIAILFVAAVVQLRYQGRLWICSCGYLLFWAGDIWSADNSQHWSDPYSFTHILHGFVFLGMLAWAIPRYLTTSWALGVALFIEALWEVIENTEFVIQRYREATAAIGYTGDTIVNSMGDIILCGLGFGLALYLGFRRSLIVFVVTELILLFWIRDSLLLNVVMLIYPIEAIRAWQIGF